MGRRERTLTPHEQQRKAAFERVCEEMAQNGYRREDLTVSVLTANLMAVLVMLPFGAAAMVLYLMANPAGRWEFSVSLSGAIAFFVLLLLLMVLHEAIHGLIWGFFAKGHRKAISFGVIWRLLTPYCTCSEPLARWQYVLGAALPTLLLGFGLAAVSAGIGSGWLLLLSETMIFGGGGDFLIILKLLLHRHRGSEVLYYDHPYECGVVAFVRG